MLFMLSGSAGLAYQVLWVRQFTLVLGASSYAVAMVLTAFMFGLGFGSWGLGKLADRWGERTLLRCYVAVELGVAAWALLLPVFLGWTESAYILFNQVASPGPVLLNAVRLFLAFLLLLVPTTFIGGTLPLLSRLVVRNSQTISVPVAALYTANTFGAILGVLVTGYVLLPHAGVHYTTLTAVGCNVCVAAGFWLLSRRDCRAEGAAVQVESAAKREPADVQQLAILIGFCVSGAATMLYEVAWSRTLVMILGTTTYAFTTMLAVILVGITLGSALYRYIPAAVSRTWLYVVLQMLVGFSVLATIPAFEKLPFVFLSLYEETAGSWLLLQVVRFSLCGLVMLIPTVAMGMLFPVVSALFVKRPGHVGSRIGQAYAVNTFGAAAGACLAGLVLVPGIGMERTILAGSLLNLLAALGLVLVIPVRVLFRGGVIAGTLALLLFQFAFIGAWSPHILNSGVYVYASRYESMRDRVGEASGVKSAIHDLSDWDVWELAMKQYKLLFYDTGPAVTVAVMERPDGLRFLTIDGKTDASTSTTTDMRTQVMIGQLPMLFHDNPEDVLVVGLGSGVTVGSVLTHPVRSVDCAEISPAVIKAATLFAEENHDALDDPRLHIVRRDARNYLLTAAHDYDAIVSQPSNPWVRGESSLFTKEYYELCHSRLRDDGVFVQWVPAYHMAENDLKLILRTLASVFDDLTLWSSGSAGDLVIVAKKGGPFLVDHNRFLNRVSRSSVWDDIARLDLNPALLPSLLFVMNGSEVSALLDDPGRHPLLNTDDHLVTEFLTPKRMVAGTDARTFLDPHELHGDMNSLNTLFFDWNTRALQRLIDSNG